MDVLVALVRRPDVREGRQERQVVGIDAVAEQVGPTHRIKPSLRGARDLELVGRFEGQLIRQALSATGGNKKEAAQLLNLKRTTLTEKIKKRNIDSDIG